MGQKHSFSIANGSDHEIWLKLDIGWQSVSLPGYGPGHDDSPHFVDHAKLSGFIRIERNDHMEFRPSAAASFAFMTIVSNTGRVICHGRLINQSISLIVDRKERILEANYDCVWLDKSGQSHK
jgi:hypothetical protein